MVPNKSALIVHSDQPLNGAPPLELLGRDFLTPLELFFIRNHGSIPPIDANQYRLAVTGMVAHPLRLPLAELRQRFPRVHLVAALQCAGNRRRELMEVAPIPGEIPWGADAIGNAVWSGWRLRDILEAAGVDPNAGHVAFTGLDVMAHAGGTGFGGSIPFDKAMDAEVLIAEQMNGAPLDPAHGFPVRAVVPGYIGARSVKWLGEITVQARPSDNYYQAQAYKLFPPQVRAESADWTTGLMLGEVPVNAVICEPATGAALQPGPTLVRGYAVSGGGRRIVRVDLTADGGRSWQTADLAQAKELPWSWTLFKGMVEFTAGRYELSVRAWDAAANTQPEDAGKIWNFKGYMNNAWHRVRVRVA